VLVEIFPGFPNVSSDDILPGVQGIRTRVGEAAAALRGVFANPGLRRIELAFAGSAIGDYAFFLTLGVFAYRQGGATAVGVVTAVRLAVAATVSPFTASLADRFPRRRVMLGADLGRCAAVAVAGTLAAAGSAATAVYALAVLTSVFATAFRPAEASLLPVLAATPEELVAANVTSSTFESVGIFAGPAIAAPLYAVGGAWAAFAFVAATYAWSSLNVARIPAAGERSAAPE
jgi:MFS family permease